jgi:D-xylose transport system permease protein
VSTASGGGDLTLNVIAAAVIGGISLFGGRGRVWAALLGALMIGSALNGMDLLSVSSGTKFAVIGAILVLSVTVDALSRKQRRATGRF